MTRVRRGAQPGFLPATGWIAALAIVFSATGAAAQRPTFTSGIDLVHVGVTITDDDGNLITDLTVDDFDVLEDGQPQEISYFSVGLESDAELIPLHLGLLFDMSESMGRSERFQKTAAIRFLNTLTYAADMTVVDFDTEVRVGRYGQADFGRLIERIRGRRPGGYTALYDALGVYLDGAFEQDGRKVLVLYTDGEDTRSRLTIREARDLLRASDVTVYAVGFQESLRSRQRLRQRVLLNQLTELTGGYSYFPNTVDELDEIYARIAEELDGRYSLGFVSANGRRDGTWRELEVRLRDPDRRDELRDARIRVREGYFAPWSEAEAEGEAAPDRDDGR
ncbi:MAG: VWA domain-containing protein [Acidobacteria bacterium]|nr:VWA domain-containing protein [Acidobacteriota bacterium]MYD72291.1 VWA domain-containing protein [Acidobacteriota bacterium]MYJ04200.1 VWA domain-containing protein [Acidobacteriota bacterium]